MNKDRERKWMIVEGMVRVNLIVYTHCFSIELVAPMKTEKRETPVYACTAMHKVSWHLNSWQPPNIPSFYFHTKNTQVQCPQADRHFADILYDIGSFSVVPL